jgi:hypothetical protein
MTKDEAIKTLIALAYCTTTDLHCLDCPMTKNEACWCDEDIREAVKTLEGDRYE